MNMKYYYVCVLFVIAFPAKADDFKPEPGFRSLFNGQDLSGWRLGKVLLEGKTSSPDERFVVNNSVLEIKGATGMKEIDTIREHNGDFILRLEFRASPLANSGLHLRSHEFKHQLQIRDYPGAGPYKALKRYKPGDWNEIEVAVKADPNGEGAVAHCTCNGEVLEEALPIPAKGAIGLQSETNLLEYRRIRIKDVP